ncbi:Hypothetical predicted protein [Paramuricea clavata]|uniref:Uncharacterized protein n=1 Tax=Paramuricea clavata TaxID=317549 RepID=A0A6S7HYH3_PARCT|nr:Hypothetical predicted protein [Paramuricea clavata]
MSSCTERSLGIGGKDKLRECSATIVGHFLSNPIYIDIYIDTYIVKHRYLYRMADQSDTEAVTVTSEKKDPKRVEAGKRLAILSKAARERKKKEAAQPKESTNNDNMITYLGVGSAMVSLVLAFSAHQRETREPEVRYVPSTVEVTKKLDESKLDSLE